VPSDVPPCGRYNGTVTGLAILRIIARLNMGGPARHTVLLDAGLRQRGFHTLLVHGSLGEGEGSFEYLARAEGLPTRRIPALGRRIHVWDDIRAFAAVTRTIWHEQPDIVHTHTAKAGVLGRVAAALYNATRPSRARCAVVHTFHGHVLEGYFGRFGNTLVRIAERGLGRLTDCTIAISDLQRRDLVERYRVAAPDRTTVVPLGLDLHSFAELTEQARPALRRQLGLAEEDFSVGFVGRFVPIKNLGELLRAVAIARKVVPRIRLALAGDGPDRATLEATATRLGIRDRVDFLGWRTDLVSFYGSLDVLALASANEGTPVAIIEAMAAGVPVVATAVGGVPDVIEDGVTGLLTEPAADAIAAGLVSVAQDRIGAARRASRARQLVAKRYDPGQLVDRIAELYRHVLERKRGPSSRQTAVHFPAAHD
jgi:glycosyltransferase involved in cell wall biosynthesis